MLEVLATVAIVLTAFLLRIYHLDTQSLWPDEVYDLSVSYWSIGQTWTHLVFDHVPLYTLLLGGWRVFTGTSAFSLRYFSAIFSTLSVPLTLILARRVLKPSTAYVAALLTAISPFQLYYAQEVVVYSLLGALALLSSWLFIGWAKHPTGRVILAQSLLYGILAYTHYLGLFVLATHIAVVALVRLSQRLGAHNRHWDLPRDALVFSDRWILAWVGGVLLFLPWVVTHLHAMAMNAAGGTSRSVIDLLTLTFTDLSFGYAIATHLDAGVPSEAAILQHLAWASLLLPVCSILAILPRRQQGHWTISRSHLVVLMHAMIPYAALICLVQMTRDYASRYGFPATFWVSILVVAGLWYLRPPLRWLGVGIFVAYSGWGALIYFQHPGFSRLNFRGAISYIVQHRRPGDAVIVTAPLVIPTFDYYAGSDAIDLPRTPLPATIPMDISQTQRILARLSNQNQRLWVLRWQDYSVDPHGVIGAWLAGHAIHEQTVQFRGGLSVDRWLTRPPTMSILPAGTTITSQEIGKTVHLVGFASRRNVDAPAESVSLYWRLSEPLTENFTVFVHMADQNGRRVAQADALPYHGQYPTTRWPVGLLIKDDHQIALPRCLPSGTYNLDVGFYVLKTLRRLGPPGDDTVRIPIVIPAEIGNRHAPPVLFRLPSVLRLDQSLPARLQSECD